jgi:hypothetical protein
MEALKEWSRNNINEKNTPRVAAGISLKIYYYV